MENRNKFERNFPANPPEKQTENDRKVREYGRSLILEQVTNGLAVRMAVLFLLNGGKGPQGVAGN
jgi:aspartate carbamoyltransferase catalytic subunit